MSFVTNQLPEAFQEDHGTDEAELPAITAEEEHERYDEVLEMDGLEQRVWLVKVSIPLSPLTSTIRNEADTNDHCYIDSKVLDGAVVIS